MSAAGRVVDKNPALKRVSGTFAHLVKNDRDFSLPAMAKAMDLLWSNGGESTHDIFRISKCSELFEITSRSR